MSGIGPIRRRTRRLELRALTSADQSEFVRVTTRSREAWAPWVPARPPSSTPPEEFRQELRRAEDGVETGVRLRLAGFLDDGRLAGLFALNDIVRGVFQNAHAAWQVAADVMGKGLGTEGVDALLDIAFAPPPEGLGLHRVQANIMPANAPSLRIAERLGFRREGFAERYLKIAGRWEDHVVFAITAEERGSVVP